MKVGVLGGGVAGCLAAMESLGRGWDVTLFDAPDTPCCSVTAAGMLAPLAELESAEDTIYRLGMRSLELWPALLDQLPRPVAFECKGSVLLAHKSDLPLLRRFMMLIERRCGRRLELLSPAEVQKIEPDLTQCQGVFLPEEGIIDCIGFLEAARQLIADRCTFRRVRVARSTGSEVEIENGSVERFDWVIDCRGIGAKREIPDLRGVRGEIIWVHAPEVTIHRAVRMVHPRYHVYIVPHEGHVYLVGASSIETEDLSPLSVRTALELLSALYAVHPAFAEARIIKSDVNLRPAVSDNEPRVEHHDGVTRINGLFRHGYLIAPAIVRDAVSEVAARTSAEVSLASH